MNDLLRKINETFDNSINNSSDEVALQLRILKGNINTLFNEEMNKTTLVNTPNFDNYTSVNAFDAVNETVSSIANDVVSTNKKNILIIDDSSIIRNYLQKVCGDKYNTIVAQGGSEAINLLATNTYDLIFLDLMMPGIDGFGVLEYLKNNAVITPIIIISGDTTKETIDKAFSYNVVDMIEKPFSEKTILEKLERILG